MKHLAAPVVACARHRMTTDGQGVTTLVCFHGCPLRCRYCINPFSFDPKTRYREMTPHRLYDHVRVDELYFLATGGGVTFGGGEPLLYSEFLRDFRSHCGESWHLCAETSLNVPGKNVGIAAEVIDHFYIDCKDTDPEIYHRYTGRDNRQMLQNLEHLLTLKGPEALTVRVPLIPEYNTEEDRQKTKALLTDMGIQHFDFFPYKIK